MILLRYSLLFVLLTIGSIRVHAETNAGEAVAPAPVNAAAEISNSEKGLFGVRAGIGFGYGSFKSVTSIAARTLDDLGFTANAFVRFKDFDFGPHFEWHLIGQITDPSTVGGTNVRANGYLLGAMIGWHPQTTKLSLAFGMDLIGKYGYNNVNTGGQSVKYNRPIGMRLKASYPVFLDRMTADLAFRYSTYSETTLDTTASDLGDDKVSQWCFLFGATYTFF